MAGCVMGRPQTGSLYALCLWESSRRTTAHTIFNGSLHGTRFAAARGRKGAGKPAPFDSECLYGIEHGTTPACRDHRDALATRELTVLGIPLLTMMSPALRQQPSLDSRP